MTQTRGTAAGPGTSSPGPAGRPPAYVCNVGHRTPYTGSQWTVISCPQRIGARVLCGRTARLER